MLRMHRCLQFRLRAMAERKVSSALLDDLRVFATAFARSISYVDVWAVWYVGLGRRYAGD